MRKIILVIALIALGVFVASCSTQQYCEKRGYYAETIPDPDPEAPERLPLPHPVIPRLESGDDPNIPSFMTDILKLNAAVEKYEILVEIYEREYLNIESGNERYQNKSLEELKKEYYNLLGIIDDTLEDPVEEEVVPEEEETVTDEVTENVDGDTDG